MSMLKAEGGSHNRYVVGFLNSRLGRVWRVVAATLSFALYGACSSVGMVFLSPVLVVLLVFRPGVIVPLMRHLIGWWFRRFIRWMTWLGLISYSLRDMQKLQTDGLFVIANHPTFLDTIFLIALTQRPTVVVSSRMWRNPFTGLYVKSAGYVSNARPETMVRDCAAVLQRQETLLVFFEGTRSRKGEQTRAQRGAAQIAIAAAHDFQPVLITCNPVILSKQDAWWYMPPQRPHFSFRVLPSIAVGEYAAMAEEANSTGLAARRLSACLEEFYDELLFNMPQNQADHQAYSGACSEADLIDSDNNG